MAKRKPRLGSIRLDGSTQPRAEIDNALVREYAEYYAAGVKMPPLIVFFDGVDHWLADGFHRWHAARRADLKSVPCDVRKGTREDARWFSYSANKTHGLRRDNEDKARAVRAALKHPNGAKMSDRQIAEHVGVDPMTVGKYRKQLEPTVEVLQSAARTGRDGRTIQPANIGKKKTAADPPKDLDEGEPEEEVFESVPGTPEQIARAENTLVSDVVTTIAKCWRSAGGLEVDVVKVLRDVAEEYEANQ